MANEISYKPLLFEKLQEFSQKHPDYSFGEIVHSIMTQLSKKGVILESKGDLLSITDEELYVCICKSIKEESSDNS